MLLQEARSIIKGIVDLTYIMDGDDEQLSSWVGHIGDIKLEAENFVRHDHGIALNETVIPKPKILKKKKKVKFDSLPLRYVGAHG